MDQALSNISAKFSGRDFSLSGGAAFQDGGSRLQGKDLRQFFWLQALRILAIFPVVYFVAGLLKLGTPPLALSLAASIGVLSAGRLVYRRRSVRNSLFYHGGALVLLWLGVKALEYFTTGGLDSNPEVDFRSFRLSQHLRLLVICLSLIHI